MQQVQSIALLMLLNTAHAGEILLCFHCNMKWPNKEHFDDKEFIERLPFGGSAQAKQGAAHCSGGEMHHSASGSVLKRVGESKIDLVKNSEC